MFDEKKVEEYLRADFDTIIDTSEIITRKEKDEKLHGYMFVKITSRHFSPQSFWREVPEWVLEEEGLL